MPSNPEEQGVNALTHIQKQGICFNCFHIIQWNEPSEFPINGNPVIVCPNCGSYIECNPWKGSVVSVETQSGAPSETVLDLGKGSVTFINPVSQEEIVTLNDPSQMYTVLAAERRYIPEEQEQNPETNPVIYKIPDIALGTGALDMIQDDFVESHGITGGIVIELDSDEDDDDDDDDTVVSGDTNL